MYIYRHTPVWTGGHPLLPILHSVHSWVNGECVSCIVTAVLVDGEIALWTFWALSALPQ